MLFFLPKSKDPFRHRTPSCAHFVTQLPGSKNPIGTGVNANSSTSKNADTGQSPAPVEKNEIIGGYLPPRVLGIVVEWTALHQRELMDNWERARNQEHLNAIEPLV